MIALQYSPFGYRPLDLADELERRRQVYESELTRAGDRLRALQEGNADLRRYKALLEDEWLSQRQLKEGLLSDLTGHLGTNRPGPSAGQTSGAVTEPPPPEPGSLAAMELELSALRTSRQQILTGVFALIHPFLALDPSERDATTPEMGDKNG